MSERSEVVEKHAVRDAEPVYRAGPMDTSKRDVPPGYKLTEVGVIPKDWKVKRIGDLAILGRGRVISHNEIRKSINQQYPVFSSQTSQEGLMGYIDTHDFDGEYVTWTTDGVNAGRVFYRKGQFNCTNVCGTIKLKEGHDPKFISLILGEFTPEHVSRNLANPKLMNGVMARIQVPLPRCIEQRAIAAALSDADALIASLDRLIAKKRAIKQAAMQQLLTGQTRLPGFTGEWETKRLGEVAEIDPENLGVNTPGNYTFSYISLEQVEEGALLGWSTEKFSTAPSRARRVLREGDILVSTVRPNLKSHLKFGGQFLNAVCSTGFTVVRCALDLADSGYIYAHLFGSLISCQIDRIIAGSNYPAISSSDVRRLELPLPRLEEQAAIATVLSDMDTELEALERRRDKARQIKQGMMQQLLTGRVRLVAPQTKEPEEC